MEADAAEGEDVTFSVLGKKFDAVEHGVPLHFHAQRQQYAAESARLASRLMNRTLDAVCWQMGFDPHGKRDPQAPCPVLYVGDWIWDLRGRRNRGQFPLKKFIDKLVKERGVIVIACDEYNTTKRYLL